ncbi:PspA/IM30 family protein [Alkalihalobacillus trypoxylicola]|uniref:Phage shock protein A n=1 Tax=Alkalihalobacillus trypoxylicola TaxID=519424 RepID=A0A162E645_9BACI|nr:PspA/IM30 family protein [Alkalihalobacillus trypoxylicola]KYG31841.1 hypothetical protein AZF04_03420 [Alkalihalobacillus trypoxylicola]
MSLTRIRRFISASINEGLEKVENPVMMIKQYLREIKAEVQKIEKEMEKQEQLQDMLQRDRELALQIVEKRESQAKIAVDADQEELARKALLSKKDAYNQAKRYEELLSKSKEHVLELKQKVEVLKKKYHALRDKKMELSLRLQAERANKQLSHSVHLSNKSYNDFDQLDEQMEDLEWSQYEPQSSNHEIEKEMYQAEIELELQQLKKSNEAVKN